MGQYKKSTLTAAGERLVAQAIGGEIKLNITKVKTSNHQYPDGTNFKSLVDMDGIVQTMVGPKTAVYNDTLIQTRALFSNEEVKETYYIHNIGLYAMDGSEEVLFSISSATTPDEMPKYDGVAPTTCIYNIQNTISETSSVSLTINPAGYASIADIMELDEKKVDKTGDISETTINALDEPATDVQFPVPVAGESTKTFLGKVKKFFEDTKNWMTGVCLIGQIVNNCVTNNAKLPLSAAQGKVLMDLYTVLNTKSAGHPDYANAVSIFKSSVVSNTSYTVPFDGILTLVASSISSAGSVSASVNGVTIANWRDNGASSSSSSTGANVFTVPVKNGDIVVLGASNNAFFTTSSRLVPYS